MTDDQEQEQERIRLHLTAYNAYYWRNLHPKEKEIMAKTCDWCAVNNCYTCEGHCGLCSEHRDEAA